MNNNGVCEAASGHAPVCWKYGILKIFNEKEANYDKLIQTKNTENSTMTAKFQISLLILALLFILFIFFNWDITV